MKLSRILLTVCVAFGASHLCASDNSHIQTPATTDIRQELKESHVTTTTKKIIVATAIAATCIAIAVTVMYLRHKNNCAAKAALATVAKKHKFRDCINNFKYRIWEIFTRKRRMAETVERMAKAVERIDNRLHTINCEILSLRSTVAGLQMETSMRPMHAF